MYLLDLKEFRKDLKDVLKRTNCSLSKSSKGDYFVINVKGDEDDRYYNAEEFVEMFPDKYKPEEIWDLEGAEDGVIVSCLDCFDTIIDGDEVLKCNYSYRVELNKIIDLVRKGFIKVCEDMGIEDTSGDIRKSLKLYMNGRYLRTRIYFSNESVAKDFELNWFDSIVSILKLEEGTDTANSLESMFSFIEDDEGNPEIVYDDKEKGYYIEGFVFCKEESSVPPSLDFIIREVSKTIASNIDSNWHNNHLNMYLSKNKNKVEFKVYGLGKVNWSDEVSLKDLLNDKVTDPVWKSLVQVAPIIKDYANYDVSWKFNCGVVKEVKCEG